MSVIGENLKRLLKYRGMKQNKLAKELHTSQACVSRYVNGQRTPKVTVAFQMAQILQVDINEILRGDKA